MTAVYEDLAKKVRTVDPSYLSPVECELIAKLIMAYGQHFFDQTGGMFISGFGGAMEGGLPEYVIVCPSYGADFSVMYHRRRDDS